MSIMMVTSLNTYTQNMEMKMKWQKRQTEDLASREITSKTSKSSESSGDGQDSAVRRQLEDIRESQKDNSAQMAAQIDMKLMAGKRLSAKEMEYLKEHDPETYKKAKAVEMEREAYERELKNCRTKEEVQRVKAAHAAAGLDQVNNIKNNPNIPSGKKLALIKQELSKSTALEDSMRSFVKSGEYKKLPTEAERLKAEKDMEEARKAELGLDEESKAEKAEEKKEETAEPSDPDSQVSGEVSSAGEDHAPAEDTAAAKVLSRSETIKTGDAAGKVIPRQKKTRAQAEVTPEARKVRHARARAAYTAGRLQIAETQTPVIDIKK